VISFDVCFGSPFTFTGELTDANTLLYLRARYYNPALGVFTALDPVGNGNRYQYVSANPANRSDPSGLQDDGEVVDEIIGDPEIAEFEYETLSGTSIYSGWNLYYNSGRVWMSPGISGLPQLFELEMVEPGIRAWNSGEIRVSSSLGTAGQLVHPNITYLSVFAEPPETPADVERMLNAPGESMTRIGSVMDLYNANQLTVAGPSGGPSGVSLTAPYDPSVYVDPILQAIARGECLETPDPSNKRCDPAKALAWMLGRGMVETTSGVRYDYQRFYAGLKYRVDTGTGDTIVADGARSSDCALIDTKYVENPSSSPYVIGSTSRELPFMSDLNLPASVDSEQNDEFRRYGDALRAPDSVNPFVKLDVITNKVEAFSYFQFWINRNNVPNATVRYGPWP
jgi:RHS repeat-associated protein